jgi:hypothetical protein
MTREFTLKPYDAVVLKAKPDDVVTDKPPVGNADWWKSANVKFKTSLMNIC